MVFEHAGHGVSDSVIAKIRRKIRDSNFLLHSAPALPGGLRQCGIFVRYPKSGTLLLARRIGREREKFERIHHTPAGPNRRRDSFPFLDPVSPIAALELGKREIPLCIVVRGIVRQYDLISCNRFIEALQREERISAPL